MLEHKYPVKRELPDKLSGWLLIWRLGDVSHFFRDPGQVKSYITMLESTGTDYKLYDVKAGMVEADVFLREVCNEQT